MTTTMDNSARIGIHVGGNASADVQPMRADLFEEQGNRTAKAAYLKAYRLSHKSELVAYHKAYRLLHKAELMAYGVARKPAKDAYNKAHRAEQAAYRKEHKAESVAYCQAHKVEIAARKKAYRKAHRAETIVSKKRYYAAHRDQWADYVQQYQAKKRNALVEKVSRAVVYERDGGRCHLCGKKVKPKRWHLEHIIPLARGGEHSYRNVAVSCPKCNLSKHTKAGAQLRLI